MAIPTFKVVKSELGMNCTKTCHKESKNEKQKGCQKEKCILNNSFSTGQFIVAQVQHIDLNTVFVYGSQNDFTYENEFIPKYKDIIWEPPETKSYT